MKQSGIILSVIITVGVSASAYAFVTSLHPCAGDRSYECLFGDEDTPKVSLSGEIVPVIPVVATTTQTPQVKQANTIIETQAIEIDTTLADQEAAAKRAKAEADAQRIAAEQAAAKLATEQAALAKLAAEEAEAQKLAAQKAQEPIVQVPDRYDEDEEEEEEEDD